MLENDTPRLYLNLDFFIPPNINTIESHPTARISSITYTVEVGRPLGLRRRLTPPLAKHSYTRSMSSLAELLRYQIAYTAWADRRVMSAVKQLAPDELDHDFKTSEKSIRCTLAHIYRAERMWLSRITGPLLEFRVEGDDDVTALFANWPGISEKWINWSRTITDQGAAAEITYLDPPALENHSAGGESLHSPPRPSHRFHPCARPHASERRFHHLRSGTRIELEYGTRDRLVSERTLPKKRQLTNLRVMQCPDSPRDLTAARFTLWVMICSQFVTGLGGGLA
jgi:hypothetical protein